MKRITTLAELLALKRELGVRDDWHEPDEQGVTVEVHGSSFDNAGTWPWYDDSGHKHRSCEVYVEVRREVDNVERAVATVNLATLFSWATGYERRGDVDTDDVRAAVFDTLDSFAEELRNSPGARSLGVVVAAVVEEAAVRVSRAVGDVGKNHEDTYRCPWRVSGERCVSYRGHSSRSRYHILGDGSRWRVLDDGRVVSLDG